MSVLEDNLQAILDEKNAKIIPENIKKDVTILGVKGSLDIAAESLKTTAEPSDVLMGKTAFSKGKEITGTLPIHDIYKFNSIEEMNRFTLAQDKEYGIVYNDIAPGITSNTTYTSVTFPSTVILTDFQYTSVPQEVLTKAKELAFGYENYIVLQNTSTGEYYIPHQNSIYNSTTFQNNGWKMTWYKETWSFHSPCWSTISMVKYDAYSHTFSNTSLSTLSTNSTVLYDWGTYKLEPVYASKNILINVGHDEWSSGEIFYRSSATLTSIGTYSTSLPYVNVDMASAEFFFNGFSDKVTYVSNDGIVYTRTDTQDRTLSCNVTFSTSNYNKVLPYFIKSGSSTYNFIGLYQYYANKWTLAPTDMTATVSNLLVGKKAYGSTGVINGTMPNNGSLTYIPGENAITIPAGYTSGGIVQAVDMTSLSDYAICDALADEILGETFTYTSLEYIETVANSYIELPYKLNNTMSYQMTFQDNGTQQWGVYLGDYSTTVQIQRDSDTRYYILYAKVPDGGTYITYDMSAKTTITQDKEKLYFDNTLVATLCAGVEFQSQYNMYINTVNKSADCSKMKLYNFRLWDDSKVYCDLQPVVRSDGKVGMFDNITRCFYSSNGTAEFIGGGM